MKNSQPRPTPLPVVAFRRLDIMTYDEVRVGTVITGPLLPEPIELLAVVPLGDSVKLIGKGLKTGLVRDPVLSQSQLAQLRCSPPRVTFDGDPALFRLGIEAQRLGLAYEYDPYFSLSTQNKRDILFDYRTYHNKIIVFIRHTFY